MERGNCGSPSPAAGVGAVGDLPSTRRTVGGTVPSGCVLFTNEDQSSTMSLCYEGRNADGGVAAASSRSRLGHSLVG